MTKKCNLPKILLDCDVIIHFIKAGKQLLLPKIYPNEMVILDKVKSELDKRKKNIVSINNFIAYAKIEVVKMPNDLSIIKEYSTLKKSKGEGEAACMAVARFSKDYIASSNLSDIASYCEQHEIKYLTTMDILLEANNLGLMSEQDCYDFIKEVKDKDSKLIKGVETIEDYKKYLKK